MRMSLRAAVAGVATTVVALPVAASAEQSVTITNPEEGATVESPVSLEGVVGQEGGGGNDVTIMLDVSGSTYSPNGMDCNGDGVADAQDDLNGDHNEGDVLDCEIAGALSLAKSLRATNPNVNLSLAIFGSEAATAKYKDGSTKAPISLKDGNEFQFDKMVRSVANGEVELYTPEYAGGGTDFDAAVAETINKADHVFMLSDGMSWVSDETLANLQASDTSFRTFAITESSDCTDLGKIAQATGGTCTVVKDPSQLTASLTDGPGVDVDSVVLELDGQSYDLTLGTLNDFVHEQELCPGEYTALVTATYKDGNAVTDEVTFTVEGDECDGTEPAPTPGPEPTPEPEPEPGPNPIIDTGVTAEENSVAPLAGAGLLVAGATLLGARRVARNRT